MAIGHPFGLVDAVSTGVLQSVGELPLELDFEGGRLSWVQADVRLGPGNSGGPLADAEGRVIGVAAMIVAGMALAVPTPEVEALLASSR
jgi:serine protease Do